jgi:hypothetical protein
MHGFHNPFVTAPYHERDEIRNCAFNILYRRTSCDFIGEKISTWMRYWDSRGGELNWIYNNSILYDHMNMKKKLFLRSIKSKIGFSFSQSIITEPFILIYEFSILFFVLFLRDDKKINGKTGHEVLRMRWYNKFIGDYFGMFKCWIDFVYLGHLEEIFKGWTH